jgi:hypothetical protein
LASGFAPKGAYDGRETGRSDHFANALLIATTPGNR